MDKVQNLGNPRYNATLQQVDCKEGCKIYIDPKDSRILVVEQNGKITRFFRATVKLCMMNEDGPCKKKDYRGDYTNSLAYVFLFGLTDNCSERFNGTATVSCFPVEGQTALELYNSIHALLVDQEPSPEPIPLPCEQTLVFDPFNIPEQITHASGNGFTNKQLVQFLMKIDSRFSFPLNETFTNAAYNSSIGFTDDGNGLDITINMQVNNIGGPPDNYEIRLVKGHSTIADGGYLNGVLVVGPQAISGSYCELIMGISSSLTSRIDILTNNFTYEISVDCKDNYYAA